MFPKDPTLKDFLTSGPAVLGALQLQHTFEAKHSLKDMGARIDILGFCTVALKSKSACVLKAQDCSRPQDCEEIIEKYAYWGGDRGLTESIMREACGMPPRDLRQTAHKIAAVINVEAEEEAEAATDNVWSKVQVLLLEHLLQQGRCEITALMLKRVKLKDGKYYQGGLD